MTTATISLANIIWFGAPVIHCTEEKTVRCIVIYTYMFTKCYSCLQKPLTLWGQQQVAHWQQALIVWSFI